MANVRLHACLRREAGGLSTYIASAMVLPLLLAAGAGGSGIASLIGQNAELTQARAAGVLLAEVEGGVTPDVISQVQQTLTGMGISPQDVSITGTPAPVPWGQPIEVVVTRSVSLAGFPWTLVGLDGRTVTLGGTTVTTSNLAPPE